MFKKNPNKKVKRPTSAIPQRLLSRTLEPSFDYPGLSFIDNSDDDFDNSNNEKKIENTNSKSNSNDNSVNGECRQPPKYLKPALRALDSPTKSLHFEIFNEEMGNPDRRSSLCILALKAATHASSPILNRSSNTNSLNSMISLPGVPPVIGVNDAKQVQLQRQKSKKLPSISSPRLQSEEDLILKMTRKQEFSEMRPTKLKEESDILQNIKKREMVDKIAKGSVEKREKVEKKKIQNKFGIASGILNSRALFLAPITGIEKEHELLIPPPINEDPKERRIVRRFMSAKLYQSPEMIIQAETRFAESPFVIECLEWHNSFRKRHLAPELSLDPLLCATAQHWANMLAHKEEFFYQNPANLGENLFVWIPPIGHSLLPQGKKKKPDVSGEDASVYWYKTHIHYDYSKEPNVQHAHADPFTQMIWHSTQHFGCGKARSRCGKVIAVAYYEPKGNIEGQFHENIFPPVKDDTGNGNCEFYEQDESEETKYCDNNLIVILYINVINLIVLLILVIVVI